MAKLIVFNSVSIDGYFVDVDGDMSWAHAQDEEFATFTRKNASGEGVLLFGRITYELMASYWPTEYAADADPVVADGMNRMRKIVFSRTMETADWENTRIVKEDLDGEVRRLKRKAGPDLVILGSGTIVSQLASAGLVDEYQLIIVPVALGGGRSLFAGIEKRLRLDLAESRAFRNGNVFLRYV